MAHIAPCTWTSQGVAYQKQARALGYAVTGTFVAVLLHVHLDSVDHL